LLQDPRVCMAKFHRVHCVWLVSMCLLLFQCGLYAAEPTLQTSLEQTREQLSDLQTRLRATDDEEELQKLRAEAQAIQATLRDLTAPTTPELAGIEARLAELGAAPAGGAESADIATQRRSLERQRATLTGQIKLAGLINVEIDQTVEEIAARRRAGFQERLGDRTHSLLSRGFWNDLADALPRDGKQLKRFLQDLQSAIRGSSPLVWLGALSGSLAILLARRQIDAYLPRVLPTAFVSPFVQTVASLLLWTVATVVVGQLVHLALTSGQHVSSTVQTFASHSIGTIAFGIYTGLLARRLLTKQDAQLRLLPVSDAVAAHLQWFPSRFVAVLLLLAITEQLVVVLSLSLGLSVALETFMTMLLALTLAYALRRATQAHLALFGRIWGKHVAAASAALPMWISLLAGIAWIVLVSAAFATLLGYVAFGSFLIKQTAWILILVATAYLLIRAVDDLLMALLHVGQPEEEHFGAAASPSARRQAAVLLSAAVRIAVVFFAAVLLIAPYGAGPLDAFQHTYRMHEGLAVGTLRLRPESVGRALMVLIFGVIAVKLLRRWTQQNYLPTTRMDVGMRESVTSLLGYIGYVVVIALSLSALGVGLQQIAWVASALAVGIGFGLQAIVQNFVSGLILLAERPVRVGDWVALGDIEGDIRRINVRATEIQRGDRSTVIVPNSEFITKAVRNVTFASALGLVQIKLPMPLTVDVERVRDELLAAFKSHPDVLQTPAPSVLLDGIDNGNLIFNATAFVNSPRLAYGVRSAVLFSTLSRLRQAHVTMINPVAVTLSERLTPPASDPPA